MFNKKIVIFHQSLKEKDKGGAEVLMLSVRDRLKADFWAGGYSKKAWDKVFHPDQEIVQSLWNSDYNFQFLHQEKGNFVWRYIKQQLFFAFSPKVKELEKYDLILYSYGVINFIPSRLKNVKQVAYVHTPPRKLTDQFETFLTKIPKLLRPLVKILRKIFLKIYTKNLNKMDFIICNSQNIKNRLKKFTGIVADEVIFPPVNTEKFKFIGQGDYYLTYSRLDELKRVEMIVEAFGKMPDKKLIVAGDGPLRKRIEDKISNYPNVNYVGRVSDVDLIKYVGSCIAGVYIPVDEDAGITQLEIMSAGKPVIGVKDGGLIETVIDGKTGVLLPKNITIEDLVQGVEKITPSKALEMRDDCQKQAKNFSQEIFFQKLEENLKVVFDKNSKK